MCTYPYQRFGPREVVLYKQGIKTPIPIIKPLKSCSMIHIFARY